jgi:hypothetical protein
VLRVVSHLRHFYLSYLMARPRGRHAWHETSRRPAAPKRSFIG